MVSAGPSSAQLAGRFLTWHEIQLLCEAARGHSRGGRRTPRTFLVRTDYYLLYFAWLKFEFSHALFWECSNMAVSRRVARIIAPNSLGLPNYALHRIQLHGRSAVRCS